MVEYLEQQKKELDEQIKQYEELVKHLPTLEDSKTNGESIQFEKGKI